MITELICSPVTVGKCSRLFWSHPCPGLPAPRGSHRVTQDSGEHSAPPDSTLGRGLCHCPHSRSALSTGVLTSGPGKDPRPSLSQVGALSCLDPLPLPIDFTTTWSGKEVPLLNRASLATWRPAPGPAPSAGIKFTAGRGRPSPFTASQSFIHTFSWHETAELCPSGPPRSPAPERRGRGTWHCGARLIWGTPRWEGGASCAVSQKIQSLSTLPTLRLWASSGQSTSRCGPS